MILLKYVLSKKKLYKNISPDYDFFYTNQEIAADVENDQELNEESSTIHHVLTQLSRYQEDKNQHSGQKWKLPPNGQPICLFSGNPTGTKTLIRPDDDSESL